MKRRAFIMTLVMGFLFITGAYGQEMDACRRQGAARVAPEESSGKPRKLKAHGLET